MEANISLVCVAGGVVPIGTPKGAHIKERYAVKQFKTIITMTLQEYKNYINKANNGTMPDDINPAFILSMTNVKLLMDIANGKINITNLAKIELANMGLNLDGKWVGYEEAKKNLKQF